MTSAIRIISFPPPSYGWLIRVYAAVLMVAITVILAAVIGAFIFGMFPSLLPTQNNQPVGFIQNDDNIVITNNGGTGAQNIEVQVNGYALKDVVDPAEYGGVAPTTDTAAAAKLQTVGGSIKVLMDVTGKTVTQDMVITASGEINGNRVVLAQYIVK